MVGERWVDSSSEGVCLLERWAGYWMGMVSCRVKGLKVVRDGFETKGDVVRQRFDVEAELDLRNEVEVCGCGRCSSAVVAL